MQQSPFLSKKLKWYVYKIFTTKIKQFCGKGFAWYNVKYSQLHSKYQMNKLKIITSTTRPERKGIFVADWIKNIAITFGKFDVELLDLAVINLPLMDEPNHPRLQQYTHEHTKKWSAIINEADAFIIVLSEYNFSFPAPIKMHLITCWMSGNINRQALLVMAVYRVVCVQHKCWSRY